MRQWLTYQAMLARRRREHWRGGFVVDAVLQGE